VINCMFSGNTSLTDGGGQYGRAAINCTFSGNSPNGLAGALGAGNCIFWGNTPVQIAANVVGDVTYCDVEGGWPGIGNINLDPLFVDPINDNLRLSPGSPCIDAGGGGGFTDQLDLDGNPRAANDLNSPDCPQTPGLCGDCPIIDMGAYEVPTTCPWDFVCDEIVGIADFLALLAAWGPNPGHPADFDGDGFVGIVDFLALLANWGPCR